MLKEKGEIAVQTVNQILLELWEAVVYFQSDQCKHNLKRPGQVADKRVFKHTKIIRTVVRPEHTAKLKEPLYEVHYSIKIEGIGKRRMCWDCGTEPKNADAHFWGYCLEWVTEWLRKQTMTDKVITPPIVGM